MQGRAAIEPVHQLAAMQQELVQRVDFLVFHDVEVGVVAVATDLVAIGTVPAGVLDTEVFGRHEFGVEFNAVMAAGDLVGLEDDFQPVLHEANIGIVVAHGDAAGFGRLGHAIDADGEKLLVQRDEACIVDGQHVGSLIFFHQPAVGKLVFVDLRHLCCQITPVLFQPVHVEGDDIDGTGGHSPCPQRVGKGAVFDGVAQAAAGSQ